MPKNGNKDQSSTPAEIWAFFRQLVPGVKVWTRDASAWVVGGDVEVSGEHYDFVATVVPIDDDVPRVEVRKLVVECRAGGPPIGARLLQRSRVGDVCAEAVAAKSAPIDEAGNLVFPDGGPWEGVDVDQGAVRSVMRTDRRGWSKVDEAELRAAAKAYKKAQKEGRSTTQAVALALHIKPGIARKRIMMARDKGLLPPPPPSNKHQRNRKGN